MKDPGRVADCIAAMREAVSVEVTAKCRIGVDDQDPEEVLPEFLSRVGAAGCERFTIHARKAWLEGLSPKENRDIPPLDYDLVMRMRGMFGGLHLSINGGITSLDQAEQFLDAGLDGVMIGRSAYHDPTAILAEADKRIYGKDHVADPVAVARAMQPYIEAHLSAGGKLGQVTRHMLGLFTGRPGARQWRRVLSEGAHLPGAGPELVDQALESVIGADAAQDR
jgi:tRNA-dihydrouridine synthase A